MFEDPLQDINTEALAEARALRRYQRLDQAILASQPFYTVLDLVLEVALELTEAHYGSLRFVDYPQGQLVLKAHRGATGPWLTAAAQPPLPLSGASVTAQVVRTKRPACYGDLPHEMPTYVDLDPRLHMLSELAVPIFSSDGKAVVGVLNVESTEPHAFHSSHERALQALAPRALLVVQRGRLSDAHQTMARKVLEGDSDALWTYTVETLAGLLQVPVCSIWLLDDTTGDLVIQKSVGRDAEAPPPSQDGRVTPELVPQTFIGKVLTQKKPASLPNVQEAPEFYYHALARHHNWRSTLAVPILTASEEPLGVISVYSKGEERCFTEDDHSLALAFANHVAVAWQQNALLVEKKQLAQQVSLINDILTASVSSDDLDTLLRDAALLISKAFGYCVDLCVREPAQLVFKATTRYDGTLHDTQYIYSLGQGITGIVASTGQPLCVADVSQDQRYVRFSPDTRSELAVPLIHRGNVIGVLNVESRLLNAFTPEHERMFTAIAAGITLAMENARRHQERKALHTIATVVSQGHEITSILDNTTRTILNLFKATACSLYLVEHNGSYLRRVAQQGLPEAVVQRALRLQQGESIAGKVWASASPLVIWDALNDPRTDGKVTESDHLRSIMAVPVTTAQGILGVLMVLTADTRYFTQIEVEILEQIGGHVGLALAKDRSAAQYRRLFEGATDSIFVVDNQGRIQEANMAAAHTVGYAHPEELLQRSITTFIAEENAAAAVSERLSKAFQAEPVPPWAFRLRHPDGITTRSFESNLTPVRDPVTNAITFVQAIWRDITTRTRRNQQFTALLELTQHAIRPFEHEDFLTQVARGAQELLESDRCVVHLCKEHMTLEETAVFPPPTLSSIDNLASFPLGEGIIGGVAATGRGQSVNEVTAEIARTLPSSMRHPPVRLLVMPVKSPESVVGVISVARCQEKAPRYMGEDKEYLELLANLLSLDLAYRRLAEVQARQQTAVTLLAQIDLLGGFLAHKVCGFLGAIGMTADLLHSQIQTTNTTTAQLLGNLYQHGRTADRLVTQFRNMQKMAKHQTEAVPLDQLVADALQHVGASPHITVSCTSLTGLVVQANRELLCEVLEGVIQNGCEAMTTGTLAIAGELSPDKAGVFLTIRDTGPGIPLKARDKLFQPFYSTKTDAGGGLGLGLWLSRLYLQTLGGDIGVTHTSAQGTTFTLRLPTAQKVGGDARPLPAGSQLAETRHTAASEAVSATTPHVLLVEDAAYWQNVLAPALMLYGFHVQVADSASGATCLLARQAFDAFVVDVRLVEYDNNNMEGLSVVEQIRTYYPSAPVVLLSVWAPSLQAAHERFDDASGITVVDKIDRKAMMTAFEALARQLKIAKGPKTLN